MRGRLTKICPRCRRSFEVYHSGRGRRFCSRFYKAGGTFEERFWAKVRKTRTCWLWMGYRNRKGYGVIGGPNGKHILARRASYEIHFRAIPTGKYICHHCDNPPCVRPDHLWPGTNSENILDASRKGRHQPAHGEHNPNARVTPAAVEFIRREYARVAPHGRWPRGAAAGLRQRYQISRTQLARIVNGESWSHL